MEERERDGERQRKRERVMDRLEKLVALDPDEINVNATGFRSETVLRSFQSKVKTSDRIYSLNPNELNVTHTHTHTHVFALLPPFTLSAETDTDRKTGVQTVRVCPRFGSFRLALHA